MRRVLLILPVPGTTLRARSDGILLRESGKEVRPKPHPKDGYLYISVVVYGERITTGIHRLVAAAFHGPCPDGLTVNHRNSCRVDNAPRNLEYKTIADNIKLAWSNNSPGVMKMREEGFPNLQKAWIKSKQEGHPHLKLVHQKQKAAGFPNLAKAREVARQNRLARES